MSFPFPQPKPVLVKPLLITSAMIWVYQHVGPLFIDRELQLLPAFVLYLAFLGVIQLATNLLRILVDFLHWYRARLVTGKGGTAGWARVKDFAKELCRKKSGPFWGVNAGRDKTPIIADYVSNALTLAPAGAGKGIFTSVPMGLSILHSKIFADFKGELVCMLKKPLAARDEIIRVLNPGNLWQDRIGRSDTLNPNDIIVDDLNRPVGLRDVMDDLSELVKQILPEPADRDSENTYFREGSRRLNAFAILIECMIDGYDATLSSVALLIEDRNKLEYHAR